MPTLMERLRVMIGSHRLAIAVVLTAVSVLSACSALRTSAPAVSSQRLRYPETSKTNHVDVYHGISVEDPYRWLEDDNSPATAAWVEAQNKLTFAYLAAISERPLIRARLQQLWNFEKFTPPRREGNRYFFSYNNGLQNQFVLCTAEAIHEPHRVLIDPNTLSPDGTVALTTYAPSHDGRFIAYGLASAGSDWQEWHVRDVVSGRDLEDRIQWVKFSGASWTKDCQGFFYSRYDEPSPAERLTKVNYYQKLYYHRLGTPQTQDKLIYHRPDQKEWGFNGTVTDDGRYLIITVTQGTDRKTRVFYLDLADPNAKVVELLNEFDAAYNFIDNDGPLFWFHTDLDAPRGRVIAIDTRNPQRTNWREVIPEANETIQAVNIVGHRFIVTYLRDAHSNVKLFDLDGRFEREIPLPGIGTASGFAGKRSDTETFFGFTSFTVPNRVYRYDLATGTVTLWREPKLAFRPEDYETSQFFCKSKDGTRIPIFVTHRKGLKPNGSRPTLLYGYGGFNISITPSFNVANLAWLEMGGVYAVANIRGGGEYGENWHLAGTKLNKQNVF
ncbi:MAG: S9 family peptidase, partial [Verrucomicrobiae bacterium]|nr:S9 family peptidase [Verrucomicrobiae bacterium]